MQNIKELFSKILILLLFVPSVVMAQTEDDGALLAEPSSRDSLLRDVEVQSDMMDDDMDSDTLEVVESDGEDYAGKVDTRDYSYLLQKQYYTPGQNFSKKFIDRLDIGFMTGVDLLMPAIKVKLNPAVPLGAYARWKFDKYSSLRASVTYSQFLFKVDDFDMIKLQQRNDNITSRTMVKRLRVGLDYQFDLTAVLNGHNPQRRLSILPSIGLSYIQQQVQPQKGHENVSKAKRNIMMGQFGIAVDLRLTRNSHVFIEPYVAAVSDQIDYSYRENGRKWDIMYGVRGGVGVDFSNHRSYSKRDSIDNPTLNKRPFFEISQGVTLYPSKEIGLGASLGTNYNIAVGKWLDPWFGVRLSANYADYVCASDFSATYKYAGTTVRPPYKTQLRTQLMGGRVEVLLDVLNFIPSYRRQKAHKVGFQLSAGAEIGGMHKSLPENARVGSFYAAFVAGAQVHYYTDPYTSVFVDPHYALYTFTVPYTNAQYSKGYTNHVVSANVGLRISRPDYRKRHVNDELSKAFVPKLFFGLAAGSHRGFNTREMAADGGFKVDAGAFVGYEFTPLHALKGEVTYVRTYAARDYNYTVDVVGGTPGQQIKYRKPVRFNRTQHIVNTHLGYVLNFSNWYQGYNERRRLTLSAEFGPSLANVISTDYSVYSQDVAGGNNPTPIIPKEDIKTAFGIYGGVIADVRIAKGFSAFVEPTIQYNIQGGVNSYQHLYGIPELLFTVKAGVVYRFDPKAIKFKPIRFKPIKFKPINFNFITNIFKKKPKA